MVPVPSMQHKEEDLPTPITKRTPLLAMTGLLPETKTVRMKMPVILITLLLVCMAFLGFRYWTVYQLSDRYQRRISFLESNIYRSSKDGDDAEAREHDFQQQLRRQKDKLVQMNAMMNSEVAKLRSKFQLKTEELIQTVNSKNEIITQNEEVFSRLKKEYTQLQQHMANFQMNQTRLLEKFTTQSVRVEMLLKMKDTCYAQMRSLGQQVSIPSSLGKEVPAREGPGDVAPYRGSPVAGTLARESPGKGVSAQESPHVGVPARESPSKDVQSRESPAEATAGRPSAVGETPARKSPGEGMSARESPRRKAGQSAEIEEANEKEAKAAPAPAIEPSGSRAPAQAAQLGKKLGDMPPRPAGQSAEIEEASEKEAKAVPAPALQPSGSRAPAQAAQLGKKPGDMPPHPDEPETKETNHGNEAAAAPALKPSNSGSRMRNPPLWQRFESKDKILGQSSANEKANEKKADAAPALALLPSNLRVPVKPPQLEKEHESIPSGPEKSDTVVQKQKKVLSGAPVVKEDEDVLPPFEEED